MIRTFAATVALLFLQVTVTTAASCVGTGLSLASVAVRSVNASGGLNRYVLTGTVVNLGDTAQASNVLQFVDIYQRNIKLDDKGIPPLKPGQSYTFSYVSTRSLQAGSGTTTLTFRLRQTSPGSQNCNPGDDQRAVTF